MGRTTISPIIITLIVVSIITFPSRLISQQWRVVESGVTSTLNDVVFVSKLVGYICGDDSTLFKTTDGGTSWFLLQTGVGAHIRALSFVDETHGWITTSRITKPADIYRTTDGGLTWLGVGHNRAEVDIHFIDRDTGWVVSYPGKVYRTTNGGIVWEDKSEGLWGVFNAGSFINGLEGWVVGAYNGHDNFDDEVIWHTTDGGDTWEFQEGTNRSGPLKKIHVLPNGTGFAYGWGEGIRTMNRGETWEIAGPGNVATALYVLDEEHIHLHRGFGDERYMYMSKDTGKTWSHVECEDISMARGMFFLNPSFGWAVGTDGKIWRFDTTTVGVEDIPQHVTSPVLSHAYPNPVYRGRNNGLVTINVSGEGLSENIVCNIYNIIGQRVYIQPQAERTEQGLSLQFDTNGLPPGVYFYRIVDDSGTHILSNGLLHIIQ